MANALSFSNDFGKPMRKNYFSRKTEADGLKKIDTAFLRRNGYLQGWRTGKVIWTEPSGEESSIGIEVSTLKNDAYIRFRYNQSDNITGEKKQLDYRIPITSSPCNLGGKRYWFVCPWHINGKHCGRRVGVLYKNGDCFACRHCYELTYHSKNENRRNKNYQLFEEMEMEDKILKLTSDIKRPYYKGKPTKKQRRLQQMCRKIGIDSS